MDAITGRTLARERTASAYRADIDGLRAIAVAAVVLFHAGVPGFGGGFVGVDIFFVISGFLIGGLVHGEIGESRFRFVGFYARRARRILPALLAVTFATFALGLVLLSPTELARFAASAVAALLGASNLFYWQASGYFTADARVEPFLMTWSLGVEEQFYLLLPPLMLALHRLGRRAVLPGVVLLSLVSFGLSVVAMRLYPVESFFLLPTRAWELGLGVVLALTRGSAMLERGRDPLAAVGLLAIVASVGLFTETVRFPGHAALLPAGGAALLIAARGSVVNRRLLAARPLVAIGLLSYSWYLWHWPLMALARICAAQAPAMPVMLGVAAASLALAWLSWRFVERPFRPAGERSDRHVLWRYALVLGVGVAVALGVYGSGGLPQRLDVGAAETDRLIAGGRSGKCLVGDRVDQPDRSCVSDPSNARVALLGDSHAGALASALRADAGRHGYGFVQFTKSSCPPLLGGTRAMGNHPGHAAACARFNDAAIKAVVRDPSVRIVVLTGFWQVPFDPSAIAKGDRYVDRRTPQASSEEALRLALTRTLLRLRAGGKRVILLGDVPGFRFDPARESRKAFLPLRRAVGRMVDPGFASEDGTVDRRFVVPIDDRGARIVGEVAGGASAYASLADAFCDATRCRFAQDAAPLFIDPQHLSRRGAERALETIGPLIWADEVTPAR